MRAASFRTRARRNPSLTYRRPLTDLVLRLLFGLLGRPELPAVHLYLLFQTSMSDLLQAAWDPASTFPRLI